MVTSHFLTTMNNMTRPNQVFEKNVTPPFYRKLVWREVFEKNVTSPVYRKLVKEDFEKLLHILLSQT